jgi:hypothetical protein
VTHAPKGLLGGPGTLGRTGGAGLPFLISLLGTVSGVFRNFASFGWRQFDAGTARLGQSNGNGLFGGTCAVFAFADMVDFFADKFSSLSRRSFAFSLVSACPLDRFFFWHDDSLPVFVLDGHVRTMLPIERPRRKPLGWLQIVAGLWGR